jgi:hypothetical protein
MLVVRKRLDHFILMPCWAWDLRVIMLKDAIPQALHEVDLLLDGQLVKPRRNG